MVYLTNEMRPSEVCRLGIDRALSSGFKVEAADPDLTMLENLQKKKAPNRTLIIDNVASAGRKGMVELPGGATARAQDYAGYLLKKSDLLSEPTSLTIVKSRNVIDTK